jgi:hypothetical protein
MITYDDQMTEEVRKRNADVWAVACNYREDTKVARDGAKAYVGHMGGGSGYSDLDVIVRSRGGRHVALPPDWAGAANLEAARGI